MKFRNREINVFSVSALDLFASAMGAFILIAIVLMPYFLRAHPDQLAELRQALTQAQSALAQVQSRLSEKEAELDETRSALARTQATLDRTQAALEQTQATLEETQASLEQTQASLEQTQAMLEQTRAELEQCRQREAACQQELSSQRQGTAALQSCQAELNACEQKLSKTFLAVVIQWPTEKHDVDLHIIDAAGHEFYYERPTIAGRPGELSADTVNGPGVEIWELPVAPPGRYSVLFNFFGRGSDPPNMAPAVVKGGVYHRDGHDSFRERQLTELGRSNALLVAIVTVRDDGSVDIDER